MHQLTNFKLIKHENACVFALTMQFCTSLASVQAARNAKLQCIRDKNNQEIKIKLDTECTKVIENSLTMPEGIQNCKCNAAMGKSMRIESSALHRQGVFFLLFIVLFLLTYLCRQVREKISQCCFFHMRNFLYFTSQWIP